MDKINKLLLVLLIFSIGIFFITGNNGGNTSASSGETEVSFLEVGEEYIVTGAFGDSSYGVTMSAAKIKVLAIDNNWIKARTVGDGGQPEMFENMSHPNNKWDYFWLNLDNILGIVK